MDLDAPINETGDKTLDSIADDTATNVHEDAPVTDNPIPEDKGVADAAMFKDMADAEGKYKGLQRNITEKDTALKDAGRYKDEVEDSFKGVGGIEKAAQTLQHLQSNQSFRKWAKEEQQRLATGNTTGEGDMNEAEKKGLEIVDNRIQQQLNQFKQTHLDPHVNRSREANLDAAFDKMDQLHPNWRDNQATMEEMSKLFDPAIQENPKFEHVESLYKMAKANDSDLKSSEEHQKELAEKQKLSTGDPPIPGEDGGIPKVRSIEEAFAHAIK